MKQNGFLSTLIIGLALLGVVGCSYVFPIRFVGSVAAQDCSELALHYYYAPHGGKVEVIKVFRGGTFDRSVRFRNVIPEQIVFKCGEDSVGHAAIKKKSRKEVVVLVTGRQGVNEHILQTDSLVLSGLDF